MQRLFMTEIFGKPYGSNARSKPVLSVPDKLDPVAYKSMSAMTRVTGLSKTKFIDEIHFKSIGDIKRSSTAMHRAELKRILVSADDTIFLAMILTPLSGKVRQSST